MYVVTSLARRREPSQARLGEDAPKFSHEGGEGGESHKRTQNGWLCVNSFSHDGRQILNRGSLCRRSLSVLTQNEKVAPASISVKGRRLQTNAIDFWGGKKKLPRQYIISSDYGAILAVDICFPPFCSYLGHVQSPTSAGGIILCDSVLQQTDVLKLLLLQSLGASFWYIRL